MKSLLMTAALLITLPGMAVGQTALTPLKPNILIPSADANQQILNAINALSTKLTAMQQEVDQQDQAIKFLQGTVNLNLTETDKVKAISATSETAVIAIQGSVANLTSQTAAIQTSLNTIGPALAQLQSKVADTDNTVGIIDGFALDMTRRLYMTCIIIARADGAVESAGAIGEQGCTSGGWYSTYNGDPAKGHPYNFDTPFLNQSGVGNASAGKAEQPKH